MNIKNIIQRLTAQEDLNFLLTNRIPRMTLTRFMGWWSQIKNPWIRDASIGTWKLFSDLDLSEAKKSHFESMHDCFTRELKPGARSIDMREGVLSSPCDAIVGACGRMEASQVIQAKGSHLSCIVFSRGRKTHVPQRRSDPNTGDSAPESAL